MDQNAGPADDRINAARLVRCRLKDFAGVQREPENVAVILGRLADVPHAEHGGRLPNRSQFVALSTRLGRVRSKRTRRDFPAQIADFCNKICQKQTFGLRLASIRMTEMRIAEACCVFEPEAESAVSPNMNDPDRADRKEEHIGE